jgi:hypothetical protein
LLWLCLQRLWPRWRDALVLVQPATVARWRRRGFWECWRPQSRRRPGRPRIAADIRALIRRIARENGLWGARWIHGELLKLRITVSERAVSRYLPDRTRRPSQTWRTFLANHFSDLTLPSSLASSGGRGEGDLVDTCVLRCPRRRCQLTQGAPRNSGRSSIGLLRFHARVRARRILEPTFTTKHLHARARAGTRQVASVRDWPYMYMDGRFLRLDTSVWHKPTDRLR